AKGLHTSRQESPMSTRLRCPHCRVLLSIGTPRARMHLRCPRCGRNTATPGAPRPSAQADAILDDAGPLASPPSCAHRQVLARMVAGLLAGVAGVVVCVWAVEGGSPGLGSKERPVIAQAGDPLAQERNPGPAADPPPADQATPQA